MAVNASRTARLLPELVYGVLEYTPIGRLGVTIEATLGYRCDEETRSKYVRWKCKNEYRRLRQEVAGLNEPTGRCVMARVLTHLAPQEFERRIVAELRPFRHYGVAQQIAGVFWEYWLVLDGKRQAFGGEVQYWTQTVCLTEAVHIESIGAYAEVNDRQRWGFRAREGEVQVGSFWTGDKGKVHLEVCCSMSERQKEELLSLVECAGELAEAGKAEVDRMTLELIEGEVRSAYRWR